MRKATTNFQDVLGQMATSPVAKKANGKKDVSFVAPTELQKMVDEYVSYKMEMKKAETEMKFRADNLIEFGRGKQDEAARKGNFMTSFKIVGKKEQVTFVSSNRWTIPMEGETELKRIAGDLFDDMVKSKFNVTLNDEVLADDKLQKELMGLLGDKFKKFFTVQKKLVATDTLDETIYKLNDEKIAEFRSIARQYNPALK